MSYRSMLWLIKKSNMSGIHREIYLENRTSLINKHLRTIFSSDTYKESQMWVLEDEYKRVTGRFHQPD